MSLYFLPLCCMSLSPMSHVKFKKCSCHGVNFRGQGPWGRLANIPSASDIRSPVEQDVGRMASRAVVSVITGLCLRLGRGIQIEVMSFL